MPHGELHNDMAMSAFLFFPEPMYQVNNAVNLVGPLWSDLDQNLWYPLSDVFIFLLLEPAKFQIPVTFVPLQFQDSFFQGGILCVDLCNLFSKVRVLDLVFYFFGI